MTKKYDPNVLYLTIKKVWFDKILSGIKTIEYREYKDYYHKKFCNNKYEYIVLQAGYSKDSPKLKAKIDKIDIQDINFTNDMLEINQKYYCIHIINPKLIIK